MGFAVEFCNGGNSGTLSFSLLIIMEGLDLMKVSLLVVFSNCLGL